MILKERSWSRGLLRSKLCKSGENGSQIGDGIAILILILIGGVVCHDGPILVMMMMMMMLQVQATNPETLKCCNAIDTSASKLMCFRATQL